MFHKEGGGTSERTRRLIDSLNGHLELRSYCRTVKATSSTHHAFKLIAVHKPTKEKKKKERGLVRVWNEGDGTIAQ